MYITIAKAILLSTPKSEWPYGCAVLTNYDCTSLCPPWCVHLQCPFKLEGHCRKVEGHSKFVPVHFQFASGASVVVWLHV